MLCAIVVDAASYAVNKKTGKKVPAHEVFKARFLPVASVARDQEGKIVACWLHGFQISSAAGPQDGFLEFLPSNRVGHLIRVDSQVVGLNKNTYGLLVQVSVGPRD